MAEFYTLPVYKACMELERQFSASTQKTPRILKYGKVDTLHRELIDLIVTVAFASEYDNDRKTFIKEALDRMKRFKIQVRILLDLRAVTQKGFAAIVKTEEDVSRQLHGWLNGIEKKENEK